MSGERSRGTTDRDATEGGFELVQVDAEQSPTESVCGDGAVSDAAADGLGGDAEVLGGLSDADQVARLPDRRMGHSGTPLDGFVFSRRPGPIELGAASSRQAL